MIKKPSPQQIEILGADGGLSHHARPSTFKIGKKILIDAGNVIAPLGDNVGEIEHIFLTHSHFDHIKDIPFLIESTIETRSKPLVIYAHPETNKALREHIFNNIIWPAFHEIKLPITHELALNFIDIYPNEAYKIKDIIIKPFEANHTVPTYGLLIDIHTNCYVLSGDTYSNPVLNDVLTNNKQVKTLILEASFPNKYNHLAKLTKHLTPALIEKQLKNIEHKIDLYTYHAKTNHKRLIHQEMTTLFKHSKNITYKGFIEEGQHI